MNERTPAATPDGAPAQEADAAIEAGRKLFAGPCDFVAAAHAPDQLPPMGLPEVAFAGRSNVGKSSLINALTGRKTLARISATPGRTQQVNFFDLGHRLILVDLPGYGYAKVSRARARAWTELATLYLKGRASLRRVHLLIDVRRGIADADRAVMDRLDSAAVPYQAVLTKCDKASEAETAARVAEMSAELKLHAAAHPDIALTSALTGDGIAELRAALAALAAEKDMG